MHPPLAHHQHEACRELIEALEACHRSGFRKFLGACNDAKHQLNLCLRAERLDRRKQNHDEAKVRRAKAEERWREIDAES